MKSNFHRKIFNPDYFAWHCYCKGAALRQKRSDKKTAKRAVRKYNKNLIKENYNE